MVTPIDGQSWASYLNPGVNLLEFFKLLWENFRHQHDEVLFIVSPQKRLHFGQYLCASLSTQRAENYPKESSILCFLDLLSSNLFHLLRVILLFGQQLFEGIILIKGQMRVHNHTGLDVESAISNKNYAATIIQNWTGTAQHFTFRARFGLRKLNVRESLFALQQLFNSYQSSVKLDDTHQENLIGLLDVKCYCIDNMSNVDSNLNEYIKNIFDRHLRYWNQTTVAVMHYKVTP